ncbi:activating molecule in BECN1-regulated autophagy protein 1A-like [Leguminivora glycinivorella]|uniref:activating molecule in BECN1-regulated autophagy protein 1A-like n=1 Tax=Leguminivora glycinivorella TaxID=1035111 RepID=UPI00200C0B98|nr:activating molecule in BECN1-regulated autophagy protein 1A-like [Leguminivora glycinivorella]
MDPIDNEWLGIKTEPIDDAPQVGNAVRSWQWREHGLDPPHSPANKTVLENIAEDILVQKPLTIRSCDLPGYPRSTFLMVFSPDGTKVASTHGNHNVYVSELASGKHVRILKGHPRTPWCIAFHPSHPQLIGSGCLGGQVRVWDISSGGSEVWNVRNETVIASIAFHPREQLLVIATYNELYFWDWSQPAPFTRVSTNNVNEKVRYVAFDALGYKLITGISLWTTGPSSNVTTTLLQHGPPTIMLNRRDDPSEGPSRPENPGTAQDMIVNSYQNLVQRYDSLVRNYQRLFMVRHRLTSTPPPPNTTDRGTDPMETDLAPPPCLRHARPSTSTANDDAQPSPSTSRRQDAAERSDGEGSSSRLLNLDVLSIDGNPRSQNPETPQQEHSIFGSRSSAFQPLSESTGRSFRTIDQNERTRLLPNPFSSAGGLSRSNRVNFSELSSSNANSSRTSLFTATSFANIAAQRRRQHLAHMASALQSESASTSSDASSTPSWPRFRLRPDTPPAPPAARPAMTNSSTQMSPTNAPVDAQAINESLDLIRDILRDSGTRLLNLITNMSLSTLASVERGGARRRSASGARSDDSEGGGRPRVRPRVRLFSSSLRRDLLSSSSDSDSDESLDINIFRARRTPLQVASGLLRRTQSSSPAAELAGPADGDPAPSAADAERERGPQPESRPSTDAPDLGADRPSTSRDNFWTRGGVVPPDEAYRRVRWGVHALQKHALLLTNKWLRGNRTTMRELRAMWENLRRRILTLHRETGRQDLPSYYTRSLLERCMFLSELHSTRPARHNARNDESGRSQSERRDAPGNSETASGSNVTGSDLNTSTETNTDNREPRPRRSPQARSSPSVRASPSTRRRLQSSYRWRPEDEIRRRSRNHAANRLSHRHPHSRSRRDFARVIEISATRHEIRMRAMQVLSVMFNMMMMCLEERGLSQLIITMLRTLKTALGLTCLMLMTNRNAARSGSNSGSSSTRVDSSNVVRIQNAEHSGPVDVDVDGPDEVMSLNNPTLLGDPEPGAVPIQKINNDGRAADRERPRTSQCVGTGTSTTQEDSPPSHSRTQKWSNRLAVQISAANRNNSATARNRRELYLESRRLKALHRTNPGAHPIVKKRVPPISHHRIPAMRFVPNKESGINTSKNVPNTLDEPVAGPSNASPSGDNSRQESPRALDEFEQRVHLIRLAHMQAVRLRSAARNRYRRLQTIRLYTPSSVREMFALQSNNPENQQPGNRSPSGPEFGRGRPFAVNRPHFLGPRPEQDREEPSQVAGVVEVLPMPGVNNVAALLQANDHNANDATSPRHRLPRIQEYLQPIILAQNAMAVDEEQGGGGGARRISGMAGLLDSGILSDALPAPAHRVQAWDFTTGDTPDIADSTKNVVVQRCRIHNDASIDISKDGRLLVALLPVPRLRNTNHWLGVYSLEWSRLGQCLHTAVLEQSAVSVALSPTARHLAVGLGSRRFTTLPNARNSVFALLFRLDPHESSSRTGLSPIKELEQNWEQGFTSLNCLRWAPQPGQGLVYANNTGQLIIMS